MVHNTPQVSLPSSQRSMDLYTVLAIQSIRSLMVRLREKYKQ